LLEHEVDTEKDKYMAWHDRITVDSGTLGGKPVIRGTRLSVEMIVDLLAAGWTHAQILESYPHLTEEDIRACLSYAGELLREEKVFSLKIA
jgi:uncharacterized protein (DUF433 family)